MTIFTRIIKGEIPSYKVAEDEKNNIPDLTDIDEVRKAIIAGEILNRKY